MGVEIIGKGAAGFELAAGSAAAGSAAAGSAAAAPAGAGSPAPEPFSVLGPLFALPIVVRFFECFAFCFAFPVKSSLCRCVFDKLNWDRQLKTYSRNDTFVKNDWSATGPEHKPG